MDAERPSRCVDRVLFPHSLGIFYTAVTQWLGFPYYGDEGKVMGLAPYGDPEAHLLADAANRCNGRWARIGSRSSSSPTTRRGSR